MYIKSFNIERFGTLKEQIVESLSPNLNIILGLNEAGKSTTLKFFQAILFGYTRGNKKLDFTATPNKGGGSLMIQSQELGAVRLLRRPGVHGGKSELFNTNEQLLTDSDLRRLLQGVNSSLFDNIYGFSLTQLQDIGAFEKEDELIRVFSGAMAGLGKVSPAEALKKIYDEKLALFGKKGGSGLIYHKIKELQEIERNIVELGPSLPRYLDLTEEKETINHALEELKIKEDALFNKKSELSLLRTLLPKYLEYCTLKAEFETSNKPDCELADDAIERIERLNSQKEEQELSLKAKQRNIEQLVLDISLAENKKTASEQLINNEAKILGIIEAKESLANSYNELVELNNDKLILEERLNNQVNNLGIGWTLDKIALFNYSIDIAKELDANAEELTANKLELDKMQDKLLQSKKVLTASKEDVNNCQAQIKTQESAVWTLELKKLLNISEDLNLSALYLTHLNEQTNQKNINLEGLEFQGSLVQTTQNTFLKDYLVENNKQEHFEFLCNKQGIIENILIQKENTLKSLQETRLFLKQRLPGISPDWSEEFLANFDFSHAARQELNALIKTLREYEKEHQEAFEAFNLTSDIHLAQQDNIKRISSSLSEFSELPELKELELRRSALRQLHLRYNELEETRKACKKAEAELADFVQIEQGRALYLQQPWWKKINKLLIIAILFSVVALSLLGVGLFLAKDLFSYLSIGVGVISAIFYGFSFIDPTSFKHDQNSIVQNEKKETRLIEERNNAKIKIESLLNGLQDLLHDSGVSVFSIEELSFLELEKAHESLAKLFDQAEKKYKLTQELLPLQSEENKNKLQLESVEERLYNIDKNLKQTQEAWENYLKTLKLKPNLNPESVLDILNEALSLRSKLDEVYKLENQIITQAQNLNNFEKEVYTCLPSSVINAVALRLNKTFDETQECKTLCKTHDDFEVLFEYMQKQAKALKLLNDLSQEYHKLFNQLEFYKNIFEKQQKVYLEDLASQTQIQTKMEQSQIKWEVWLKEHGFSPDLSPTIAKQSLALIQEIIDNQFVLNDKNQKIIILNNRHLEFLNQLNKLANTDLGLDSELTIVRVEIDKLRQALELAKSVLAECELLKQNYQSCLNELKSETERLNQTVLKIKELLVLAQVETIEAFKVVFETLKKWHTLNDSFIKLRTELQVACEHDSLFNKHTEIEDKQTKTEKILQDLTEALQAKNLEQLSQELSILEDSLNEINNQKMQFIARQGELKAQLEQLNTKDAIASYRAKENELKEELTQLRDQWLKLNLAYNLLSNTKQRLEEDRMPELIKEAGALFSAFTDGAYSQIHISMSDASLSVKNIVVSSMSGLRLRQEELSQGTKEQLYLALRLAYIREHAKHKETLPIIMDDILVNFDRYRARKTAEVLNNFSLGQTLYNTDTLTEATKTQQQLLFFTCHHATAELLVELNPKAKLLHLEKGRFIEV